VTIAVAALLAVSTGVAAAAVNDDAGDDKEDTVFSFGYDAANHVLVTGVSAAGSVYDCTLRGSFEVGYGENLDGEIPIDSLDGADGPAEFAPRDAADLDEGLTAATSPLAYDAPDNPCTFTGITVAGPNGQVNHGQVVSSFSHAIDVAGKGCVMRYIAQSGFGKGEDQVRTSDVDDSFVMAETGVIELETVLANCKKHDADGSDTDGDDDAAEENPAKDKPAKAKDKGKPESPGKSADAPGHNK
jgi:hypothetical protein